MVQLPERSTPLFDGKPYTDAIKKLIADSVLRDSDVDRRAVRLLDALASAGRAEEAVEYMAQAVRNRSRQQVSNMRAYVYSLLKNFDRDVYNAMKGQSATPTPREVEDQQSLVQGDLLDFCTKHGIGLKAKSEEDVAGKTSTVSHSTWNADAPLFVPGQQWPLQQNLSYSPEFQLSTDVTYADMSTALMYSEPVVDSMYAEPVTEVEGQEMLAEEQGTVDIKQAVEQARWAAIQRAWAAQADEYAPVLEQARWAAVQNAQAKADHHALVVEAAQQDAFASRRLQPEEVTATADIPAITINLEKAFPAEEPSASPKATASTDACADTAKAEEEQTDLAEEPSTPTKVPQTQREASRSTPEKLQKPPQTLPSQSLPEVVLKSEPASTAVDNAALHASSKHVPFLGKAAWEAASLDL